MVEATPPLTPVVVGATVATVDDVTGSVEVPTVVGDGVVVVGLAEPGTVVVTTGVAPGTVAAVPQLFARNERLVCLFDTAHGPMAVVMVGAMLVSGVETVWRGVEIPPYARAIERE